MSDVVTYILIGAIAGMAMGTIGVGGGAIIIFSFEGGAGRIIEL